MFWEAAAMLCVGTYWDDQPFTSSAAFVTNCSVTRSSDRWIWRKPAEKFVNATGTLVEEGGLGPCTSLYPQPVVPCPCALCSAVGAQKPWNVLCFLDSGSRLLLKSECFRQFCSQPTESWDLNLPKCFGAWKSTVAIRKVAALIKSPKGRIHVHFFPSFYKHKGDWMHKVTMRESSKRSQRTGLRYCSLMQLQPFTILLCWVSANTTNII